MKKYNIGKKSDLKRLERDMMKKVQHVAEEKLQSGDYEVKCKNCHNKFHAHIGYNQCPICKHVFSVGIDITFL